MHSQSPFLRDMMQHNIASSHYSLMCNPGIICCIIKIGAFIAGMTVNARKRGDLSVAGLRICSMLAACPMAHFTLDVSHFRSIVRSLKPAKIAKSGYMTAHAFRIIILVFYGQGIKRFCMVCCVPLLSLACMANRAGRWTNIRAARWWLLQHKIKQFISIVLEVFVVIINEGKNSGRKKGKNDQKSS